MKQKQDAYISASSQIIFLTTFLFYFFTIASLLPFNQSGKLWGLNYNLLAYLFALASSFGGPELYYDLGWDPQITLIDWADFNHFSWEEIRRVIGQRQSFLTNIHGRDFSDNMDETMRSYGFSETAVFKFYGYTCRYFTRVEE